MALNIIRYCQENQVPVVRNIGLAHSLSTWKSGPMFLKTV